MNAETTVARLRMEVITPTRIVRRVVDVSTKTGLQTVAAIIRTARGWWEDRHYRFHFGDERYADGNNRGANVRQAKGKALGEALAENRTFDFLHDITGGTGQTIVIESITRSSKPETAYPVLVEAAGTLALQDLTPHDSAHHWVRDADDLYAHNREYAIEMTMDEATRAEHDLFGIGVAIDSIRLSRRGPLRSHQEGSARNPTSHGLKPEPETEPPSYRTQGTHKPIVLKLKTGSKRPTAQVRDGIAYFKEQKDSEATRALACLWANDEDDPQKSATETGKLARLAPADIAVVTIYGYALENAGRHREAVDVYRHAFELGTGALPDKFSGRIDRHSDTAIGLLDAAAGLGRCECYNQAVRRGVQVLERLAKWDDDPANEAWLSLGSLYVAQGKIRAARKLVEVERLRIFHPPYDYDLALCEIMEHRWEQAMGALMRGLAGNPYIAELLLNCKNQRKMLLGCKGGNRSIASAENYLRNYWRQWNRTPDALRFVRWVQTHPATLAATAPLRGYDQAAATTNSQLEIGELTRRFHEELDHVRIAAGAAIREHAKEGIARPWELISEKRSTRW